MREADNYHDLFLSVMGVYVVRTSSLISIVANFSEKLPVLFFFLLLSVATANLSCLLDTTFSSLRFLFNFTSLQSFESFIFECYPLSSAFVSSVLLSLKLCLL